jgi:hypothetical protein
MDTVTDAEPDTPSVLAVIVTVPFATEVTKPELFTVARLASDEVHVKALPAIVFPVASLAVAVSWSV